MNIYSIIFSFENTIELLTFGATIFLTFSQIKMHKKINEDNYKFSINLKKLHFYAENQLKTIETYIDEIGKFMLYSDNLSKVLLDPQLKMRHNIDDYLKQYYLCVDVYNRTIIYQPNSLENQFAKSQDILHKVFNEVIQQTAHDNPLEFSETIKIFHNKINELIASIHEYYASLSNSNKISK